jgi:hypothetical protein
LDSWEEPIELEGILHIDIDGTVMHGKIPAYRETIMLFFDGVYNSIIKDSIEPVTAQDGLRVMQIIEAQFKVVNKKG